jgi:hypothetical protein
VAFVKRCTPSGSVRDKTYLLDACGDGAKQTKHRGENTFCKEHDRRFVLIIILIASLRAMPKRPQFLGASIVCFAHRVNT